MEVELKYEQAMVEHSVKYDELPTDAKVGITTIKKIVHTINLAKKAGNKVREDVYVRLKANDKWVVREISDYATGKKTNPEPVLPNPATAVIKDININSVEPNKGTPAATTPEPVKTDPVVDVADDKGVKIDKDLKPILEGGKTKITLEELKTASKTAYDLIFEAYKEGEENGLETSHYRLVETEKEVFTLSKI